MAVTTSESLQQFLRGEIPAHAAEIDRAKKPEASKPAETPASAEEAAATNGKAESEQPQKEADGRKKPSVLEELIETRKERNAARDKARELESSVATLTQQLQNVQAEMEKLATSPAVEDAPPKREQFTSDKEYDEALVDYRVDKRLAERQIEEAKAEIERINGEIDAHFKADLSAFEAEHTDYRDTVEKCVISFPKALLGEIPALDNPAAVTYYLTQPDNAEEARKLIAVFDRDLRIRRFPSAGMRALGRLDDKLTPRKEPKPKSEKPSVAAPEVSKAPAPIEPLKGNAAPGAEPEKMTAAQYREWRTQQLAKQRRH